jgi:hypothetical protein
LEKKGVGEDSIELAVSIYIPQGHAEAVIGIRADITAEKPTQGIAETEPVTPTKIGDDCVEPSVPIYVTQGNVYGPVFVSTDIAAREATRSIAKTDPVRLEGVPKDNIQRIVGQGMQRPDQAQG